MLQNAYFLAKFGADTAENEQHLAEILPISCRPSTSRGSTGRSTWAVTTAVHAGAEGEVRRRGDLSTAPEAALDRADLTGLVLGCIEAKFCNKICVRQHFLSSTRFAYFCTAAISKFSQKIGLKNQQFLENSANILQMSQNFAKINFKNFS